MRFTASGPEVERVKVLNVDIAFLYYFVLLPLFLYRFGEQKLSLSNRDFSQSVE